MLRFGIVLVLCVALRSVCSGQAAHLGLPAGHTNVVTAAVVSGDHTLMATSAEGEKQVILWDLQTQKPLAHFSGHLGPVSSLCFVRHDSFVVSASDDSTVRLWDCRSGHSTSLFDAKLINPVCQNTPDPNLVAVLHERGLVYVDILHHKKVGELKMGEYRRILYASSGDSFLILKAAGRGQKDRVFIVDQVQMKIVYETKIKTEFSLHGAASTSKGRVFYFATGRDVLVVKNGKSHWYRKLVSAEISEFDISADGKFLLIIHHDTARIYDAESLMPVSAPITGPKRWYVGNWMQFSPYNGLVAHQKMKSQIARAGWDAILPVAYISGDGYPVFVDSQKVIILPMFSGSGDLYYCHNNDSSLYYFYHDQTDHAFQQYYDPKGIVVSRYFDSYAKLNMATGSFIPLINTLKQSPFAYDVTHSTSYYYDKHYRFIQSRDRQFAVTLERSDSANLPDEIRISSDGKYIIKRFPDRFETWKIKDWQQMAVIPILSWDQHSVAYQDTPFRHLAYKGWEDTIYIFDYENGHLLTKFRCLNNEISALDFSPEGNGIIYLDEYGVELTIQSLEGYLITQYEGSMSGFQVGYKTKRLLVWDEYSFSLFEGDRGKPEYTRRLAGINSVRFIDDEMHILVEDIYNNLRLYSTAVGAVKTTFPGIDGALSVAEKMDSSRMITLTTRGELKIWDYFTGALMATGYLQGPAQQTVFTPSGLFDGQDISMRYLYWVKGLEIIEFDQLKERFWEPGLWEKIYKKEKLRNVEGMGNILLQPELHVGNISGFRIPIVLKKRDGGYGRVAVFINEKEVMRDGRGPGFDTSKTEQKLDIDLTENPYFFDSGENTVTIKTWSANGMVESRGKNLVIKTKAKKKTLPAFYAVICGVGKYQNASMNLHFSVPDALAMDKTIRMAASNLFEKDSIFMYPLISDSAERPDKENLQRVFSEIARKAKAEDVIFVYLSGHGISTRGEGGDFYYLTADAFGSDLNIYKDPLVADKVSLSSTQLTQWINAMKLHKQVLVIDACGSGKVVDNLVTKRSVDVVQIKAIDRMRDLTGMHIISGCAADAVSYEASIFGQGLLTYSILQAMKGAALRDNKYVDVSAIMQYAARTVPELARDIGGIQRPQILSPDNAASFDIGIMLDSNKTKIPLAEPKPVFVRSRLLMADLEDPLGLSEKVNERLRNMYYINQGKPIVFIDAPEFQDAFLVKGFYQRNETKLSCNLMVRRLDKTWEKKLEAADEADLLNKIQAEIQRIVQMK